MDYNERSLRTEIVGLEEALWQMNLQHHHMETEIGPFPERPGEPDCSYYLRTGHCRYGMNCRYNHPPNRKQTAAIARSNGEFPERIGQPECQYYLKTGTCKFGATCKFHHPRDKAGTVGRVALNALGYPLRPNEKECAYYLRTGQCKFGNTCKFHHPEPLGTLIPVHGSSLFTPVHPPTASGPQPFSGLATWPIPRTSFIQSPRWQGPSSYTPMILPQGIISVSGWNTYPPQGQLGSISSQDGQQQAIAAGPMYGPSHQMDAMVSGIQGTFSPFPPGSPGLTPLTLQLPASATQREAMFPERPGQPECQFYMKTGDCKYGMSCRFHHPKDRIIPTPTCALNHLGLPIRPDMPACNFFARYGVCKYGSTCKFDHSVGHLSYNQSISSPADISVGHHQIVPLPPLHTSASFSSYSAMESAGEMHTEHSSSDTQQLPSVVKSLGVNT